jgi:hypothetical protein
MCATPEVIGAWGVSCGSDRSTLVGEAGESAVGENLKREPDDGTETSAADEPTAIWDIEALRAAGLEEILHQQQQEPEPARRSPSTAPGPAEPSIVLDEASLASGADGSDDGLDEGQRNTPSSLPQAGNIDSDTPGAPAPMRIGIESVPTRRYGWGAALGVGAVFFGAVYALIRFLL